MSKPCVLVTFAPPPDMRAAIEEPLKGVATLEYLPELKGKERARALNEAEVVLAWNIPRELRSPEELDQLSGTRLIQLLSAGVDHVPFDRLPPEVPVAANAGAYAAGIAEHALAMALSLAKRLPQNHLRMAGGEFDQHTPTRMIRGATVAILGYGGIGRAGAALFRCLGARIHAVSRSGRADDWVEGVSSLAELDSVLPAADIVLVALPLTRATRGLIGARELSLMKPDAILINVARAAIVDEDALYEHLRRIPSFSAGIDTWWEEPLHQGRFATRWPFLELPNVLGSPHNSGVVPGSMAWAAGQAAANVARQLRGETPGHVVRRSDYAG